MIEEFELGEEFSLKLDAEDPLAQFREQFMIPESVTYFDGNSLGPLSREAYSSLLAAIDEWKEMVVDGWAGGNPPWIEYGEKLGELFAPLIGAASEEVCITGTTTVNIHTLVSTFYRPVGKRRKIIADALDFPSDIYALKSQLILAGQNPQEDLVRIPSPDGRVIREEDVIEAMNEETALVLLPGVFYRSSQIMDIPRLTKAAHERGIIIGFDCAHSIGAVPHRFSEWGVDFAVWCNYKYMNGGPGATGGLYVNRKHFDRLPGLTGWFGNDKRSRFEMAHDFRPAPNACAWEISCSSVLATAPLIGSLKLFQQAGIDRLREKSIDQTQYLIFLIDELLSQEPYSFSIGSPREPERRGGHVAIEHDQEAFRLTRALKSRGVVTDFRPPNIVRVAPIPLYNTFHQIWQFVQTLKEIMDKRVYEEFSRESGLTT